MGPFLAGNGWNITEKVDVLYFCVLGIAIFRGTIKKIKINLFNCNVYVEITSYKEETESLFEFITLCQQLTVLHAE